jgi:uncharacterized membrane protein HdeD (DUF308 family)
MIAAHQLAHNWGWVLARGLIAIAFGAYLLTLAFLAPAALIWALVILFAAFSFADGAIVLITALRFAHPESGRWWWMIVQGIAGIAVGVLTYFWPNITAWVLGILIAAWAVVTGILEIGAAFQLRKNVAGEIFLLIAGVLSVALGIILLWAAQGPLIALLAWAWLVAIYAIVAGLALVALAFRLRSFAAHNP